jgi:tetratricopeptide (TPR) repeat protein
MLRLVAVLAVGAAASAPAQLAVTQPTEKLLVLPLMVSSPADSVVSIAVMDAARERLGSLARYKVLLVTKSKMCEALAASGFPCDGLMDARQAEQLARFLSVNSWTLGTLSHNSSTLTAQVHVVSGGSGFSATFTATGGPNGSPQPLSEAIAQRLSAIIRAAEYARNCTEQRGRNNVAKALDEARKALAIEPNLPAAHLCLLSVFEIQRLGPDSAIAHALAALKGDSLNGEAWRRLGDAYLAKGDSARYYDSYVGLARSDIHNPNLVVGIASLLEQRHQYARYGTTPGQPRPPTAPRSQEARVHRGRAVALRARHARRAGQDRHGSPQRLGHAAHRHRRGTGDLRYPEPPLLDAGRGQAFPELDDVPQGIGRGVRARRPA